MNLRKDLGRVRGRRGMSGNDVNIVLKYESLKKAKILLTKKY